MLVEHRIRKQTAGVGRFGSVQCLVCLGDKAVGIDLKEVGTYRVPEEFLNAALEGARDADYDGTVLITDIKWTYVDSNVETIREAAFKAVSKARE